MDGLVCARTVGSGRGFWLFFSLGFLLIGSLPDTPWDGLILVVLHFCFCLLCSTSARPSTAYYETILHDIDLW